MFSKWLQRLFGGSGSTASEPAEPARAPEAPSMPSEPPADAGTGEQAPAGDEAA